MSRDDDTEDERPTARGWAAQLGLSPDDTPTARAIKIAVLAAPWVVGVALLWHAPLYLGIFLGVSILFLILQRRWPGNDKPEKKPRGTNGK